MWRSTSFPEFESYARYLDPDCRAYQPLSSPCVGRDAVYDVFRRLYLLVPDVQAEVHRGGHDGVNVWVEFELVGTLGGKRLRWPVVDVYRFANGLVTERIAYADPTPLVLALLSRPRAWPRWWRSGLGFPRRPISPRLRAT